jgi:glycerophosphoryl diester phosphodiesterase
LALATPQQPGRSRPLVYAHRGGAALRPENTLAAFDHGLALGADGLELDVHLSRDGVVVVHHDATLERTARLIVELKCNEPELARRTIDEIRKADAVGRVALGSFFWRALNAAREYEPAIPTGASREETRWALYRSYVGWPLGRTRYRELQVPEQAGSTVIVSPRFIAHAHRAGLPIKVWTVDDAADIRRLLGWGADAIISDRPDVAVAVAS